MYTGHTTRAYRNYGIDLLYGVFLNVFSTVAGTALHFAHRVSGNRLGGPHLCALAGIVVGTVALVRLSGKWRSRAGVEQWPESPGLIFNSMMLAIAALLAVIGAQEFKRPAVELLQGSLAVSFFVTAFLYLPALGLARTWGRFQKTRDPRAGVWSGFVRPYWIRYRRVLFFPIVVLLHAALAGLLMVGGLAALFSTSWAQAFGSARAQIVLLSLILGLFSALPFYRKYEILVFGRLVTRGPFEIEE